MRRLVWVAIFGALAVALHAQAATVMYVDGDAAVKVGSGWRALEAGDSLDADATIRLESSTGLEIGVGTTRIVLSTPGVYEMSALVPTAKKNAEMGLGSLAAGKFKKLISGAGTGQSTVGGVRGDKTDDTQDDAMWVTEEDAEALIDEGISLLEQGDAEAALASFRSAVEWADADILRRASYYYAFARAYAGEPLAALKELDELAPTPEDEFFADAAVLKASLLVETYAFEKADRWLSSIDVDSLSPDSEQKLLLFRGLASRGLGDTEEGSRFLTRARDIDPSSEAGILAESLLR